MPVGYRRGVIGVLVLVVYAATARWPCSGSGSRWPAGRPGGELKLAVGAVAALLAVQAVIAAVRVFGGVSCRRPARS